MKQLPRRLLDVEKTYLVRNQLTAWKPTKDKGMLKRLLLLSPKQIAYPAIALAILILVVERPICHIWNSPAGVRGCFPAGTGY